MKRLGSLVVMLLMAVDMTAAADDVEPLTTLDNPAIAYTTAEAGYAVLNQGPVTAVIVDNRAVDNEVLPDHRAGYSGVASLTHAEQPQNLFVPTYAGLNFEHIHDGTNEPRDILFEPRRAPMELRVINDRTVELYQPPTPHWKLESALRYELLDDGTSELTFECIPRERTFAHDYIGLFWASYIHQPDSLDIHFRGHDDGKQQPARWIRGVTPAHGVFSTHLSPDDGRQFVHDDDFDLTLVFNRSKSRYDVPWYFGVSHGMAFVQMFRPQDQVRLSQSPSGGGEGNPAWDFQFLIPDYEVGQRYQLVMRAMYVLYESAEQVERVSRPHRTALGQNVP
ncbi:MAG: hypothetical protein KDA86_08560 [Planctomycetaceae bacterium]|nr:hypothetical protein [Planctomycetaceae bacterium]